MADAPHIPDEAETRARWGNFAWNEANAEKARMAEALVPKIVAHILSNQ